MRKLLSFFLLGMCHIMMNAQVQDSCYSVLDFFAEIEQETQMKRDFTAGWNFFGFPCTEAVDIATVFSSIEDDVVIVKDNLGLIYFPEYGVNNIEELKLLEGYQIKLLNPVENLSICSEVYIPQVYGCTDCQALNFTQWATLDDGTCIYDESTILGCVDEFACNYNSMATVDDLSCEYAQEGFDCDGSAVGETSYQIGDLAFGGIVFYVDETGERGLVCSAEDLESNAWGCSLAYVEGADGVSLGYGLQNTLDISEGCEELLTAANTCLAYENGGNSDWYLPSKDELMLIYNTIGQGSDLDSIGNFVANAYWTSSESAPTGAWVVSFYDGTFTYGAKGYPYFTRAISAFGDWTSECTDALACNYNFQSLSTNVNCDYAEVGFDCTGLALNPSYAVGDFAFGGIVFYVDETGESGLVADVVDIAGTKAWGCSGTDINGSDGVLIGTGAQNTIDITAGCTDANTAAKVCANYTTSGYSDWYLPSMAELMVLYQAIGQGAAVSNIANMTDDVYWTSSEGDASTARTVDFEMGYSSIGYKTSLYKVRAIRSF